MKLKQKFFDGTVLRKDITRFAPVWILYLVGGLLVTVSTLAALHSLQDIRSSVLLVNDFLRYFSMINLVYAMVVAQLLFGDLFNSKLCNALHAMPLRREGWFFTHVTAGILFSLVPNTIGALAMAPYLDSFGYVAFLWLGAMMLQYLFFFGLSVFSMQATGKRFAAMVVYGILNFVSLLVLYLLDAVYVPMLYGVQLDTTILHALSPVVYVVVYGNYFSLAHRADCPCLLLEHHLQPDYEFHQYELLFEGGWTYLYILLGVGILLLVLGLLLYRRRQMETAGDFVAFKPMKPIFRVVFTLAAAGFCHMLAEGIFGFGLTTTLIFTFTGLVVGYFVSHMFVERTIKVFKRRTFLGLAGVTILVVMSLALTAWDVFGIASRVPEAENVEKVYIAPFVLNDFQANNIEDLSQEESLFRSASPEEIQRATEVHRQMYEEGDPLHSGNYRRFTILYKMKDGSTLIRCYRVNINGEAYRAVSELFKSPLSVLGAQTLEAFKSMIQYIQCGEGYSLTASRANSLAEALWADLEAGNLLSDHRYHSRFHQEKGELLYCGNMSIHMLDPETGHRVFRSVTLYDCCTNTKKWIQENMSRHPLEHMSAREAAKICKTVSCELVEIWDVAQITELFRLMLQDYENGYLVFGSPEGDVERYLTVFMEFYDYGERYLSLDKNGSAAYDFLLELYKESGWTEK